MSFFGRRRTDCLDHEYSSTVHSGLKRSVCELCGHVTLEPVTHDLVVPASLRRAATAPAAN